MMLLGRMQSLRQELRRARRAVEQIDPRLGHRIQAGFLERFEEAKCRLRKLEQGIDKADSFTLSQRWRTLEEIREDCEPVFEECLALLQGSLVRTAGVDEGLGDLADALLRDLGQRTITWERFTVLDTGESYGRLVQVIRVRFPEASIWSLPIAAHEFGHFVARRLEKRDPHTGQVATPVKDFLDREGAKHPRGPDYLEELFADLFATYVLGPAFACACILLRWDPWTAHKVGGRHPSSAKRVHWILKVLEETDENKGGLLPTYGAVTRELRESWQRSLRLAGQPEQPDEKTVDQLDRWRRELYPAVGENAKMVGARYTEQDWIRAKAMATQLRGSDPLALQEGDRLAMVLNAAWWCRIRHGGGDATRLRHIGQRAVRLCREIADRE
jgi:hypothetical protein